MAQRKRKGARNNPAAAERQITGGDTADKIIQNIALFAIPIHLDGCSAAVVAMVCVRAGVLYPI